MPVLVESICFLTCCSGLQFLEKENARLELEVEKILGELNHQKDQNNLKREKIVQLEISLKNSKVLPFFHKVSTILQLIFFSALSNALFCLIHSLNQLNLVISY